MIENKMKTSILTVNSRCRSYHEKKRHPWQQQPQGTHVARYKRTIAIIRYSIAIKSRYNLQHTR